MENRFGNLRVCVLNFELFFLCDVRILTLQHVMLIKLVARLRRDLGHFVIGLRFFSFRGTHF